MVATVTATIVIRPRIFALRIVGGFNDFLLSGGGRVHVLPVNRGMVRMTDSVELATSY
jgi:hypothetical protein